MLGFEQGKKRELTGPTELFVDARVFERSETAVDIAYLVTLAATGGSEVLLDTAAADETLAKTFEELCAWHSVSPAPEQDLSWRDRSQGDCASW